MKKQTIVGFGCSLALLACSSDADVTQLGATPPAVEQPSSAPLELGPSEPAPIDPDEATGEFPPEPDLVSATLGIQGDALALSIENLTGQRGDLRLSTVINSSEALSYTENAGVVALAPHEKRQILLSAADVDGLNLNGDEWTDARVNYSAHFDDLRQDSDSVSVFAERGLAAPAREVVASGKVYGFPEVPVESEVGVDKASTFKVCFENLVTFIGSFDSAGGDNAVDYLRVRTDRHVARAQGIFWTVGALPPTPPGGFAPMGYLDASGCKTFTRTTGTWSFILFTDSRDYPVSGMRVTGRVRQNSTIASGNVSVSVPSSGNPSNVVVSNPSGEMAYVQTAFVTATHALSRFSTLLSGTFANQSLSLQLGASDSFGRPSTVNLTDNGARRRSTVAHEIGHWVHLNYMTQNSDLTYCTPGNGTPDCTVPRADGCTRNTGNTHTLTSVEWNSGAHTEGMANFFAAYAMNSTGGAANCNFADLDTSCETGSMAMSACTEWGNEMFFNTSMELDWARTYWDFITDRGQSMLTYLQTEQGITGWNRVNHIDKILGAYGDEFAWAAEQNLWDVGKPPH